MTTLHEALEGGQGDERPFQCTEHDDRHDSASVNVLKGVWYCYVCHAAGAVDKKKAPSPSDLAAMLEPEQTARRYPDAWLELFGTGGYWLSRFPDWLCWNAALGQDPFTGDGTFPVYTPQGSLAGVGRRQLDREPKYLYPPRWAASKVLDGYNLARASDHVVMVEGMADRVSLLEVGIPALGCYGSGLHAPQLEMVLRSPAKMILLGFDEDPAGELATQRTAALLDEVHRPYEVITWSDKDPGELDPGQRQDDVETVVGQVYRSQWTENVADLKARYDRHLVEENRG